jgi:FlaA1/EpsC-like NDP-sugar epimerase
MLKFQTRRLVATFVLVDVAATSLAWILAYLLRFDANLLGSFIPVTKGVPELSRYLLLLPVIAVLWPAILYFHGLYQLKRGRSRIDEFFAIVFSVLTGTGLTLGAALYFRVYYRFQPEVAPLWEYSQAVFALFFVLDVALLNLGRWALRRYLERMWAAGDNVKRILVAGAGELGRRRSWPTASWATGWWASWTTRPARWSTADFPSWDSSATPRRWSRPSRSTRSTSP